jgi:DNA-binding MarR family transcriptional regulator
VVKKIHDSSELQPSISEEALEEFCSPGGSLAKLVEHNGIEVRDFVILSFVCDQRGLAVEQLARVLGLDRSKVVSCIHRLQSAGLVNYRQVGETSADSDRVTSTAPGCAIARQILEEKN